MKRLLVYSKDYCGQITIAAISSVTASIATVFIIDILRQIIECISIGNLMQEVQNIILKMLIVIGVGIASNYMVVSMTGFVGVGLLKKLRNDAVDSLMKASPEYINQCNYGDLMERVTEDIEGLAGFMSRYFKDCMYVPILTVVYSVYLFIMNAPLAVICLFPLAVMVPLNVKLLKPIKLRQFQYAKELGLTNNNVEEAFAGAEVIKSYNLQKKMMDRYEVALYKTFKTSKENDLAQYNLEPISRAIQEVPMAIAICVGGVLVFNNAITMGVLIAYISTIKKLIEPLSRCYQLVVRSQTALVSVSRVFEVIDIQPEKNVLTGASNYNDMADSPIISFKDVTFGYGQENVLVNVSFNVRKGERIAFVGESGSGKSTIIKCIMGFLKYQGQIQVNSLENKSIEAKKIMGYIPEIPSLYPNLTVDEHMEFIARAYKLKDYKAYKDALLERFDLTDKKKKFGDELSKGMQQKLSICCGLLPKPRLVLFDEPMIGLDPHAIKELKKVFEELRDSGCMVLVSTHMIDSMEELWDTTYIMKQGRVAAVVERENLKDNNKSLEDIFFEITEGAALEREV